MTLVTIRRQSVAEPLSAVDRWVQLTLTLCVAIAIVLNVLSAVFPLCELSVSGSPSETRQRWTAVQRLFSIETCYIPATEDGQQQRFCTTTSVSAFDCEYISTRLKALNVFFVGSFFTIIVTLAALGSALFGRPRDRAKPFTVNVGIVAGAATCLLQVLVFSLAISIVVYFKALPSAVAKTGKISSCTVLSTALDRLYQHETKAGSDYLSKSGSEEAETTPPADFSLGIGFLAISLCFVVMLVAAVCIARAAVTLWNHTPRGVPNPVSSPHPCGITTPTTTPTTSGDNWPEKSLPEITLEESHNVDDDNQL